MVSIFQLKLNFWFWNRVPTKIFLSKVFQNFLLYYDAFKVILITIPHSVTFYYHFWHPYRLIFEQKNTRIWLQPHFGFSDKCKIWQLSHSTKSQTVWFIWQINVFRWAIVRFGKNTAIRGHIFRRNVISPEHMTSNCLTFRNLTFRTKIRLSYLRPKNRVFDKIVTILVCSNCSV
jgi:hypothetical protein